MKTKRPVVGLLPLYLKLYDDFLAECRSGFTGFLDEVSAGLAKEGLEVIASPVCRIAAEFKEAVRMFEERKVDAVVTLHLAYSPSLESIDALCSTEIPLIILDTTMDDDFGPEVKSERIMYNHGVHGVMDMASMLKRGGRPFEIAAGHYRDSDVLARTAELAHAAAAARAFRNSRLLRIGDAFKGMGDFAVENKVLAKQFGIKVEQVSFDVLDKAVAEVEAEAAVAELASDRKCFDCDLPDDVHKRAVRIGLGLRQLLASHKCLGFSINFQEFKSAECSASAMPFLEISKAMSNGYGYAGEGDVLTAALVGSLIRTFGEATFTEIFCPDWKGNTLFLSHMGEINPATAASKPRISQRAAFDGLSADTAVLTCPVKPGPAVFINLAPGPDDSFSLLLAPVTVLKESDAMDPAMRNCVRTWIRPNISTGDFLEQYSRAGGTHHSAIVLGEKTEALAAFGRMMGFDVVRIG